MMYKFYYFVFGVFIVVFLLTFGLSMGYQYGQVVTQEQYNNITFNNSIINMSYLRDRVGGIYNTCNSRSNVCNAYIVYNTFEKQVYPVVVYDVVSRSNITEYHHTGNYTLVSQKMEVSFSLSDYRNKGKFYVINRVLNPILRNKYVRVYNNLESMKDYSVASVVL